MKEYIIKNNEAGQRFDKYLKKILPNASSSFIYKMLRKKNITLDGHKASGTEILKIGSDVKIFFSDETFDKFSVDLSALKNEYDVLSKLTLSGLKIIFDSDGVYDNSKYAQDFSSCEEFDEDFTWKEKLRGLYLEEIVKDI